MSRAFLAVSTGLPVGCILKALVPSCTATSLSWGTLEGCHGARTASTCGASRTKRARVLEAFADRLPDRLHPDDLHFLLKHLQDVPPPRSVPDDASASRGETDCRDSYNVAGAAASTSGDAGAAAADAGPNTTPSASDTQSGGGLDGGPARRTVSGFGRNYQHHSHHNHHGSCASSSAGAGFSSGTSTASHYGNGCAGGATATGSGHRRRASNNHDEYNDEYDHLHNIIFEQLRPRSREGAHTHVRVELHGFAPAGSETPAATGRWNRSSSSSNTRSSSANGNSWRHPGPQHHHQTSGPGPDVGRGGSGGGGRTHRHWVRTSAVYDGEDEYDEDDVADRSSRRRGARRRGQARGWEFESAGEEEEGEADWYDGGRPTQSQGRTRSGQRSDGSDQQQDRYPSYGFHHGQRNDYYHHPQQQQQHQQRQRQQHQEQQQQGHQQRQGRHPQAASARRPREEADGSRRQRETQQQQQRQQQQQQHQQRQEQQRQEQEQNEERGRRQGRRGVAWFTRRWPRHFVSYEEYAEFASQDWAEAEGGRGGGKYYRSAFEDDRDWASQFWSDGGGGGSGQSQQSQQQSRTHSHSHSHSHSQYAEQFTAGWWQRFQAAASGGGGAGHRTTASSSSSGSYNFNSQHHHHNHHQFGGHQYGSSKQQQQQQPSRHPPELRPHMLVLGMDVGGSLDAAGVKAAFRARAKETHPDLQHGADAAGKQAAAERFKAVQQAYVVLSRAVAAA